MTRKFAKGFTLIELLVVIAIIGILATIVLVSVREVRQKARDARRKTDLRQMQSGLELYFDSNGSYPGETGWCDSSKGIVADNCAGFNGDFWPVPAGPKNGLIRVEQQGHMNKLPLDPANNADFYYYYEPVCNQTQYGITCPTGSCCAYRLGAVLENSSNNDPHYKLKCMSGNTPHNYCVGVGF